MLWSTWLFLHNVIFIKHSCFDAVVFVHIQRLKQMYVDTEAELKHAGRFPSFFHAVSSFLSSEYAISFTPSPHCHSLFILSHGYTFSHTLLSLSLSESFYLSFSRTSFLNKKTQTWLGGSQYFPMLRTILSRSSNYGSFGSDEGAVMDDVRYRETYTSLSPPVLECSPNTIFFLLLSHLCEVAWLQ